MKALADFFTVKDTDNSGYLEKEEFVKAIGQLPYCDGWRRADLEAVAEYCDLLENGRINYLEFLNAFNLEAKDRLYPIHMYTYVDEPTLLMGDNTTMSESEINKSCVQVLDPDLRAKINGFV